MSHTSTYNVAVVGATGAVGQKMLETLEDRNFPINQLKLLSSSRSAGMKITYKGNEYTVEEAAQKVLITFISHYFQQEDPFQRNLLLKL